MHDLAREEAEFGVLTAFTAGFWSAGAPAPTRGCPLAALYGLKRLKERLLTHMIGVSEYKCLIDNCIEQHYNGMIIMHETFWEEYLQFVQPQAIVRGSIPTQSSFAFGATSD